VTEDHLAALRAPWCITRFPATESEGGRLMAAAVARHQGEEGGRAQTPPPKHRPGTFYTLAAGSVTVYGKA